MADGRSAGFPPLAAPGCRVLVLGTLPGRESLRQHQYYAHPRNAFWPIMAGLTGCPAGADYARRVASLVAVGIAVWDVLASGKRPGSLDSAIETATVEVNDFASFLRRHREIGTVCFNGATAERLFCREVLPGLARQRQLTRLRLPSTSPAHAALSTAAKARTWHRALRPVLGAGSTA